MNNQAAQTMPVIDDFNGDNAKLIESARALISLSDSGSLAHHGIGGHARAILSAFIVRTEAAALSQTAGVADGPLSGKYGDVLRPFVIQMERELHANAGKGDRPGWLKMSPEVALLEIYYHLAKLQKAVKDNNGPGIQEYAADVANMSMMLLDICGGLALIEYAAPSASGIHPDALPDGTLSKSTAKRVEALAAASVSERARELLAAQYRHDPEFAATIIEGTGMDSVTYALRAITAALTQQRGDDVESAARALFEAQADRLAAPWDRQWEPTKEHWRKVARGNLYATTPHPSADAVREYVTELRAQADHKMGVAGACAHDGDRARYKSAEQLLRRVADELESLLSAASGEGIDDTKRLDWIARQGGYEFDFGILNDQPGDGDWFVHGMGGSGQGATFRDAIDAAIKEEAGGQDANTDILDTLAFETENGDAGRGSVTYIASVASGEANHQQNAAQGGESA